jgi:hypothetical protein
LGLLRLIIEQGSKIKFYPFIFKFFMLFFCCSSILILWQQYIKKVFIKKDYYWINILKKEEAKLKSQVFVTPAKSKLTILEFSTWEKYKSVSTESICINNKLFYLLLLVLGWFILIMVSGLIIFIAFIFTFIFIFVFVIVFIVVFYFTLIFIL